MTKNIPAILEVIKYIYENIMYAEINTMTSYCHECGCTDIYMGDDLKFHCPQCGNDDYNKMINDYNLEYTDIIQYLNQIVIKKSERLIIKSS